MAENIGLCKAICRQINSLLILLISSLERQYGSWARGYFIHYAMRNNHVIDQFLQLSHTFMIIYEIDFLILFIE